MDLIFFGMQGAGKGTLGKAIAERYNLKIFETGAELRKLAQADSPLGKKVKSIIEAGHLVSNEVVMEIVENFMNNLPKNINVLFDGIPRKIEQAKTLNELLDKYAREYKAILIDIKKETALRRLTTRRICSVCKAVYPANYEKTVCECGGALTTRADDNLEAIKTRLDAYEKETLPAIEMYNSRIIKIDGEPQIDVVVDLAIKTLDPIIKN